MQGRARLGLAVYVNASLEEESRRKAGGWEQAAPCSRSPPSHPPAGGPSSQAPRAGQPCPAAPVIQYPAATELWWECWPLLSRTGESRGSQVSPQGRPAVAGPQPGLRAVEATPQTLPVHPFHGRLEAASAPRDRATPPGLPGRSCLVTKPGAGSAAGSPSPTPHGHT